LVSAITKSHPGGDALPSAGGRDDTRQAALIPTLFRGDDLWKTPGERLRRGELARRVRQMTRMALRRRTHRGTEKIDGVADRENTSKFLKNAVTQGFRLGKNSALKIRSGQ